MENLNNNTSVELLDDYKTAIKIELTTCERLYSECYKALKECKGYNILSGFKHAKRSLEDFYEYVAFMNIECYEKDKAIERFELALSFIEDARLCIIESPAQSHANLSSAIRQINKAINVIRGGQPIPYEEWQY